MEIIIGVLSAIFIVFLVGLIVRYLENVLDISPITHIFPIKMSAKNDQKSL